MDENRTLRQQRSFGISFDWFWFNSPSNLHVIKPTVMNSIWKEQSLTALAIPYAPVKRSMANSIAFSSASFYWAFVALASLYLCNLIRHICLVRASDHTIVWQWVSLEIQRRNKRLIFQCFFGLCCMRLMMVTLLLFKEQMFYQKIIENEVSQTVPTKFYNYKIREKIRKTVKKNVLN